MSVAADFALVGATASGKTALAVELARHDPLVELCSVDAFACYRRLDIGTAKPDSAERAAATWHLVDLVEPTEELSVADFVRAGRLALDRIEARGRRAGLVGGSGLYLRSLVDSLDPPPRFREVAIALEAEADKPGGTARLYDRLISLDPLAASRMEPTNRRRVVRALEVTLGSGRAFSSFGPGLTVYAPTSTMLIGLRLEREELQRRLVARLEAQLAAGFLEEVAQLVAEGVVLSRTAAQAIGYRELTAVVAGQLSLDSAREEILRRSRILARRQVAWLRRDPRIVWVDATSPDLVAEVMGVLERGRQEAERVRGCSDPV